MKVAAAESEGKKPVMRLKQLKADATCIESYPILPEILKGLATVRFLKKNTPRQYNGDKATCKASKNPGIKTAFSAVC